jgi:hypothetical protein
MQMARLSNKSEADMAGARFACPGKVGDEVRMVMEGKIKGHLAVTVKTLVYLLCKMRSH